ncbi:MAG: hypothetical protein ACK41E_02125 [Deinococcales bacterium]
MKRSFARVIHALVFAFVCFVPAACAAPLGLVLESGLTLRGSYRFTSAQAFALALEFETPLAVPIPIDVSLTGKLGYDLSQGGIEAGVLAKALVFNSISGGLLGVGLWLEVDARNVATALNTFRVAFGPYLNLNVDPFYATFSASLFSLTNGIYAFDLGLAARYYIDIFAVELGFDYNTIGTARATFGLRFTL